MCIVVIINRSVLNAACSSRCTQVLSQYSQFESRRAANTHIPGVVGAHCTLVHVCCKGVWPVSIPEPCHHGACLWLCAALGLCQCCRAAQLRLTVLAGGVSSTGEVAVQVSSSCTQKHRAVAGVCVGGVTCQQHFCHFRGLLYLYRGLVRDTPENGQ
jgi:hypothetical protein